LFTFFLRSLLFHKPYPSLKIMLKKTRLFQTLRKLTHPSIL